LDASVTRAQEMKEFARLRRPARKREGRRKGKKKRGVDAGLDQLKKCLGELLDQKRMGINWVGEKKKKRKQAEALKSSEKKRNLLRKP